MKILIAISDSFCGSFIKGQAAFLKSRGHDVIIVSPKGEEIREIEKKENCKLIELPFSREISIFNDIKSLIKVAIIIGKEKPSIINAGNPKTGFLFTIAGIFYPKVPVIFTLRGLRSDTLKGFKKKIVTFTEYLSCRLADKVIVISPSLENHAIKRKILNKEKTIVIGKGSSNGVDINKFKKTALTLKEGQKLRQKIGFKKDDFVIGFVGRITKDKGVEELYKAFNICCQNDSKIKLLLAGPLEEKDAINSELFSEMKNDKNTFILGKIKNVEVVYSAIDILVLYSHREGFGNVVLEASAMKVPVLVSDIPGLKDTVEKEVSGLLIPPKNIPELVKGIQFCVRNKKTMEEYGDLARMRVEKFFSSEMIWEEQLKIYTSLRKNEKK